MICRSMSYVDIFAHQLCGTGQRRVAWVPGIDERTVMAWLRMNLEEPHRSLLRVPGIRELPVASP